MSQPILFPKSNRFKNLIGKRYWRLVVVECAGSVRGHAYWKCQCDCGKEKCVSTGNLPRTKSCGCYQHEFCKTHGQHGRPEYRIWAAMLSRCFNKRNRGWKNYGGRGITVCPAWKSFSEFFSAMGARPTRKHTLDRIDNDGNYEPGNVRWATRKIQARNTRRQRLLTFCGETYCVSEWAERLGINVQTILARLRAGHPIEKALAKGQFPKGRPRKTLAGVR